MGISSGTQLPSTICSVTRILQAPMLNVVGEEGQLAVAQAEPGVLTMLKSQDPLNTSAKQGTAESMRLGEDTGHFTTVCPNSTACCSSHSSKSLTFARQRGLPIRIWADPLAVPVAGRSWEVKGFAVNSLYPLFLE